MMGRGRALVLLCLLSCGDSTTETPGSNRCDDDDDCVTGSTCEPELKLCAATRPSEPYEVMLQVSELGGAASGLTRYTFAPRELGGSSTDSTLEIPLGIPITGFVSRRENDVDRPVRAQLVFTPRLTQVGVLTSPLVGKSTTSEGNNLSMVLAPEREYDVTIYPLGEDSRILPPVRTTFFSKAGAEFKHRYGELTVISGVLEDEEGTVKPRCWLRIRAGEGEGSYQASHVVSSLGITDEDGSFTLHVLKDVIGARDYVLEVSLFEGAPWGSTIELSADRVVAAIQSGKLVIPEVPSPVELNGAVEARPDDDEQPALRLPNTALTFVSEFPLPPGEGAANNRYWCRAKTLGDVLSPFRCRASVTTTADMRGSYSTELLPGNYRLYISPSRDSEETKGRLTTATLEKVETQPGGASQGGQVHYLDRALMTRGRVRDSRDRPLANVVINMLPLKVAVPVEPGLADAGSDELAAAAEVGLFNRASDGVSNRRGEFEFPVDRGVFDFVVRPPEESGFAWFVIPNRLVSDGYDTQTFSLPPPLLLSGVVVSGGTVLASARVDAYAFVRDPGRASGTRSMLIASTISDAAGHYTLKLPVSVAEPVPASDAGP
jgi:hypothetical protein